MEKFTPSGHEQLASDIITGDQKLFLPEAGQIPNILESYGISPQKIGDIISGKNENYLGNIISGDIDADRLDYLLRDAYYTGVSHGNIGIERIIKMLKIQEGKICVLEKGVRSVEEMLLARTQMYPAVYWHHAVRISGLMLERAVEPVINHLPYFSSLNDFQLLEKLKTLGTFQKETVDRLLTRQLYKRAFVATSLELQKYPKITNLIQNKNLEQQICEKLNISKNHIIIDARSSEQKLEPLNIPVIRKDNSIIDIKEISSLASGIYKKESMSPLFSVYTPKEHREKVRKYIQELIA